MGLLDNIDLNEAFEEKKQPSSSGLLGNVDLSNLEETKPSEGARSSAYISPQQRFKNDDRSRQEMPEPTWGETFEGAAKNFIPSAGRVIGDTAKALTVNLPETASAIGQIVSGLSSKAYGAFGGEQTPEEKAKREALVNALGQHYAETYGSVEGFKKALESDPASILADLSLPLSGGAGALAKTARTGSMAEKALSAASKAAQFADPVQAAVGLGRLATSPVTWTAKQAFSKTAQVPPHILDLAKSAGQTTDPVFRKAFWDHYTGNADAVDIFDTAQSALKKIKQDASTNYLQSKAGIAAQRRGPMSFSKIDQAVLDAKSKIQYQGIQNPSLFTDANNALREAESLVSSWKNAPQAHTLEGFDNLKQAIWDVFDRYKGNNQARQAIGGVYDSVRESLGDVSPEYLKLMESYQSGINEINDITKTLGIGNKASATNALNKMLRQQRTAKGKQLIDAIAEQNPEFSYKLAGATLQPWTQSGARGFIEAALSGVGGIGGWLAFGHAPGAIAGAAASAAAQSPKIVGSIPYAAGAVRRQLGKPAMVGAYTAEQLRPGSEEPQNRKQETASGAIMSPRASENELLSVPVVGASTPGAIGSPVGPNQTGIRPPEGSDLFESRIVPIESQGRQSALSKKGAIGVSQIMPETGPEAAALAGEPWSLERLKTDRDYNLKLGKAYFNHLLNIFKDPVVAAAAYNGGMGAVSRALKEAEKTGVNWLSLLEEETQNYVRKFTKSAASGGRIGRASGGRISSHASVAARLVRAAEKAKKSQSQTTEALLEHSDDAIANALEIANKHI